MRLIDWVLILAFVILLFMALPARSEPGSVAVELRRDTIGPGEIVSVEVVLRAETKPFTITASFAYGTQIVTASGQGSIVYPIQLRTVRIAVPDTLDVISVTLDNATVAYRLAAGTLYLTEAAEVLEAHIMIELQGRKN